MCVRMPYKLSLRMISNGTKPRVSLPLKEKAAELGFLQCAVAVAEPMDLEARRLENWLNQGMHGTMRWMEHHFDLRIDPTKLMPGAKSVICLAYNYFHPDRQSDAYAPKISMYAYGEDYHRVLRSKLKTLLQWIRTEYGSVEGRMFTDSGPVMERDWARRAGLGWTGKHTLLLRPSVGSYFFLSELIVDIAFEPDMPIRDHCGTCTRCIKACPTGAIAEGGYLLDSRKCISYLTIEHKEAIPESFTNQMEGWAFGCDICQQVCPWNRFATPHQEMRFVPHEALLGWTQSNWLDMTRETFAEMFHHSPLRRPGYDKLMDNIRFLMPIRK